MKFFRSAAVPIFSLVVLPSLALGFEGDRVQVKVDASEAEHVLAMVAKHRQGRPIMDADWQVLFAAEPYRGLKVGEAAMHSPFSDDDFAKFLLSEEVKAEYHDLSRTLQAWKKADLRAGGERVLTYLPRRSHDSCQGISGHQTQA